MSIPKRIIQTARTADLPPIARAAAATAKLLHPDWEYVFFDDEDILRFVVAEFPQHRALFESFRFHIQRIDFFRYLAVYRLGGFYLDLDLFLYSQLNPLLDLDAVFPFEELTVIRYLRSCHGIDWEIGNYAFAAQAGDPFLGAVIENCIRAQRDPAWIRPALAGIPLPFRKDYEVLVSTGPVLLTRTLAENPGMGAGVTVLFPDDVCDPASAHLFGDYGVHLMDGSWRAPGNIFYRRAFSFWEAWSQRRLRPESLHRGAKRPYPPPSEAQAETLRPPPIAGEAECVGR